MYHVLNNFLGEVCFCAYRESFYNHCYYTDNKGHGYDCYPFLNRENWIPTAKNNWDEYY